MRPAWWPRATPRGETRRTRSARGEAGTPAGGYSALRAEVGLTARDRGGRVALVGTRAGMRADRCGHAALLRAAVRAQTGLRLAAAGRAAADGQDQYDRRGGDQRQQRGQRHDLVGAKPGAEWVSELRHVTDLLGVYESQGASAAPPS